jgi:hypothetical protein
MSEEELNAIEARVNAATSGPWAMAEYHPKTMLLYPIGNPVTQELLAWPIQGGENSQNNAAFIAHARRDVPALLAHIRELQQENTRLQSLVYRVTNGMRLSDMYQLPDDLMEELEMFRDVD